jgi:hypothetical protein
MTEEQRQAKLAQQRAEWLAEEPMRRSQRQQTQHTARWLFWQSYGPRRPPVVEARYKGRCPGCNSAIEPGDTVRPTGKGRWLHLRCVMRPSRTNLSK